MTTGGTQSNWIMFLNKNTLRYTRYKNNYKYFGCYIVSEYE